MKCLSFITLTILFLHAQTHANSESSDLAKRIEEIKARSNSHETKIAALLSKPKIDFEDYSIKEERGNAPAPSDFSSPSPHSDIPYIPVPEYNESDESNLGKEKQTDYYTTPVSASNETAPKLKENIEEAYAELYQSDDKSRWEGYYFGPLIGVVIPDDGAIRSGGSIQPYSAGNGYNIGFKIGRDFGSIKVEGEYSYVGFDGSNGISVGVNNLLTRIILEVEASDFIDLRAGMAMGVGFIGIDGGSSGEPSDVGFAYDFLLGAGYNFNEEWSLCLDYKYYLSAANDQYDRITAHALLLSANLKL